MPLTYDNTDCADLDLKGNENHRALRESAVWAMMGVGVNHITLDNVRDFYARVSFYEKINGAFRMLEDENGNRSDQFFSPDECLLLVGMRTNVSPKTKAQFFKGVWASHESYNIPRNFPEKP